MNVIKADQIYVRREVKGDVWDEVRVIAPSPYGEGEWVVAPTTFPNEDDERKIVSTSATGESLLEAYIFDRDVERQALILGDNALAAFGDTHGLD